MQKVFVFITQTVQFYPCLAPTLQLVDCLEQDILGESDCEDSAVVVVGLHRDVLGPAEVYLYYFVG